MGLNEVLTFLYALVPIVGAVGWFPQIYRLARNPSLRSGVSLATWGVWALTGLVGLLYGVIVIQDALVSFFFLVNTLGQVTMFGFAVLGRVQKTSEHSSRSGDKET